MILGMLLQRDRPQCEVQHVTFCQLHLCHGCDLACSGLRQQATAAQPESLLLAHSHVAHQIMQVHLSI